jgi:hypothetical protein
VCGCVGHPRRARPTAASSARMRARSARSWGEPWGSLPRKEASWPQEGDGGGPGTLTGAKSPRQKWRVRRRRLRQGRILVLAPYAEVALAVAEDRGAEDLVPRGGATSREGSDGACSTRGSDREGSDDDGARAVGLGLGYEGIEDGGWRKGEEGFAVLLGAVRAAGVGPIRLNEGEASSASAAGSA